MGNQAIIFLDYNETFDDISDGKGNVFFAALKRFIKHFDGNVKICVITAAPSKNKNFTIKDDLAFTLKQFPSVVREKFAFLIEENCKYISKIEACEDKVLFCAPQQLSSKIGTKKDGVELALKHIDPQNQISVCVFAGNSEAADLVMMDADAEGRTKFFVLANRRILKSSSHEVYKLSMNPQKILNDFSKEIIAKTGKKKDIVIKTSNKSYGVGKGFEAVTNLWKQNFEK